MFGAVQIGVTAYANASGDPGIAGLLYAELGVGSALAGVAFGWLPQRFSLRCRYPVFAAGLTLGMIILALGGLLLPLPVAIAIASVTISPYMITVYAATELLAVVLVSASRRYPGWLDHADRRRTAAIAP